MPLKDLLVHVDTGAAASARIKLALRLAADHQAHLKALYVMATPPIPSYIQAQIPASVVEMHAQSMREEADEAKAAALKLADAEGIALEWMTVAGDPVAQLCLHGRHADLTIVGQAAEDDTGAALSAELPESLPMLLGRPVLVVPRYGSFATVGERILVAWNGSREAARALADALPMMRRGKAVTILSIDPRMEEPRIPSADIALHLSRHGVRAEAMTTYADDIGVGDALLSRSADLAADLIVMGAYGHARMAEMILGGATRHILRHMTVPVLMAH